MKRTAEKLLAHTRREAQLALVALAAVPDDAQVDDVLAKANLHGRDALAALRAARLLIEQAQCAAADFPP